MNKDRAVLGKIKKTKYNMDRTNIHDKDNKSSVFLDWNASKVYYYLYKIKGT